MLSLEEALARVLLDAEPGKVESMPTLSAHRRFLAEDLRALSASPRFDASSMDGWAVRSLDVRSPTVLEVCGESRAGGTVGELEPRTAMRIFTGAPLPLGADAVEMQERVRLEEGRVHFERAVPPGRFVRKAGEDLRSGDLLLARGTQLGSGEIAPLIAQGITEVTVHAQPRVAILGNGDELRALGQRVDGSTVFDVNSPMLCLAAREAGAEAHIIEPARDDLDELTAKIEEGLESDVLVLSGGVSVGDHDLAHRALARAGVTSNFWKVAIKPGKPLTYGRRGGVRVFGLPGNPVSSWVTFELFVRPMLKTMLGDPRPLRPRTQVALVGEIRREPGRLELMRARLARAGDEWLATPMRRQGSATLASIAEVDALLLIPADRDFLRDGERVDALLLRVPGDSMA